jgi:hypothetical protein
MYPLWAASIRSHYPTFEYKAPMRVCTRHFVPGRDYYVNNDRARLYNLAVPTVFASPPQDPLAIDGTCEVDKSDSSAFSVVILALPVRAST